MKRIGLIFVLIVAAGLLTACGGEAEAKPPVIDTGVDPESWAVVPAGEFLEGQHEHPTLVDYDYEIMVTDVTNAQYARYLNEALAAEAVKLVAEDQDIVGYYPGDEFRGAKHEEPIAEGDWLHVDLDEGGLRLSFDGTTFTPLPGYENHPMVQVTWFGARAYCEYYDWRLPSEVEWEKAARGTDNRPYPWGDELERNNANFYSSHDLYQKITDSRGGTTPVGFYNGKTYDGYKTLDSPSPYGLYDMAGNVWQWTGNVYEEQHYRYMRGGSKMEYEQWLRVWARNNAAPKYFGPSVGFRCARDITTTE
ncbi:MAG: formylglycine-generating enzyme family protein [Anaerolineae bacterium]|nr:formylglycine-generating enzyme family protein [Anaerolineae bacterium]